MKLKYPIFITFLFFALYACETDNKKYFAGDFAAPEIESPASGSHVLLTEATAADLLTVSWDSARFGFPAALTYTVQIAKAGTYFESAVKIAETQESRAEIDYATLNNSVLIAGLVPETPTPVELRVSANINTHIETLYSEPVTITVTAYNVAVVYPILFVPGSYQGWNPGDSATIVTSPKADEIYEGYFYFPANTEFKFTGQPAWDPLNWGEGGNGKLQEKAGNIRVNQAGYYKVVANIRQLTYTLIPVSWQVEGSAVPGNSQPLTYNENDRTLEITAHFNAGGLVFKEKGAGNRVLGIYFGHQLTDDGTEILIPQSGTYTLTLDLKKYPYTFSLKN